jgi:poly-gamma-glutamate synthesis protein (capsule biosynthesis protein)
MYERQVAKAAIDAGADIVVGHHAHILRGIEI